MASYGVPRGESPRQNNYGHASSFQRDAAFSNIFGAVPPGRSQTMGLQSAPMAPDRTPSLPPQATFSSDSMPPQNQLPPQSPRPFATRPPPPQQQQHQHQQHQQHHQHQQHQQQHHQYQQQHHQQQQLQGEYAQSSVGGYHYSQRSLNGLAQQQQQPGSPHLPQPLSSDRRPYPQPQRLDSRQPLPQQQNRVQPNRGYPPNLSDSYKPIPHRGYAPDAAMNSDPYRTRSMASMVSSSSYNPPTNNYNQASAYSFRQQPNHSMASRTTAQGRIVPERHDERAMSMSSFSAERDHTQTMSGRVIPNRRRDPSPAEISKSHTSFAASVPPRPGPDAITGHAQVLSQSRSMSMASTVVSQSERNDSLRHRPSVHSQGSSGNAVISAQSRAPLVYPALLSRVADVFRERIAAGDRSKNGLSYKFAFTGAEAVDLISYIIKTTDRNLALLLGRALDAQKFFHDVTYDHRLRDSATEVFQFRESLMEDSSTNVNGVFTLLTECYSPTCTRDRLCYSIACPRRLEQQARLNLKPQPGLRRQQSSSSLHADESDEQKLWINTVTKEVADSVGDREKKRQEVISEIMYTERDFVKDLEYLRDFWMKPLRSTNPNNPSPIPEQRREKFIKNVFADSIDVHAVNSKFAEALTRRQQENPVVRNVGDIFLTFVPRFGPFIKYGANQLNGKYEFERERSENPLFSRFVDETERLKESRKLELNGYLTKPTTRLARYPLLLENVAKYTAEDNPDAKDIPQAIAMIKDILNKVNYESGKAENQFNLRQLQSQLKWGAEKGDLKLLEENRELIYKGPLKKGPTDSSEVFVYLFNHALLFVKHRVVNKKDELKVYKRPIPLELLVITQMDEVIPKLGIAKRPSSSLIPGAKAAINAPRATPNAKDGYPITFKHIGRGGYDQTLYALSQVQRRKWMEHVESQQSKLRERGNFYTKTILCDDFFSSLHKVNCLVPVDGGRKLVYGTDNGVFVSDRRPKGANTKPRRVLDIPSVTQIDVLEEYQLLLVLSNKTLLSYTLEILDPGDNQSQLTKRPKKIQNNANFFKAGVCMGRHLVCSAKMSGISTTIKVFEPMETVSRARRRMFQSGQETLKPFKEFYVPAESSSIDFLRSKLCVACSRGFEVVSLETLETQPLLDQADTSLDFVNRKEIIPISIERLNGEFLLHYSEYSFFVNRNGWRARPDWLIAWEGRPQTFALSHPYLLAFEPSFIEIRNLETSALVHIITAKNIRMLHSSTREILYAYEDDGGEDVVASLDFWSRPPQQESAPRPSRT